MNACIGRVSGTKCGRRIAVQFRLQVHNYRNGELTSSSDGYSEACSTHWNELILQAEPKDGTQPRRIETTWPNGIGQVLEISEWRPA